MNKYNSIDEPWGSSDINPKLLKKLKIVKSKLKTSYENTLKYLNIAILQPTDLTLSKKIGTKILGIRIVTKINRFEIAVDLYDDESIEIEEIFPKQSWVSEPIDTCETIESAYNSVVGFFKTYANM